MAIVSLMDGAEGQPPPVQVSPLWGSTGSPCHQAAVAGMGLAWDAQMRHGGFWSIWAKFVFEIYSSL